MSGADWDPEYAVIARGDLLPRLAAQAFGPDYPAELRPYGFTTWSLLTEIGERLAVRPGEWLLDLGCGEGGPGLWLAQRAAAHLIAMDFSLGALRAATGLAARLPQPPRRTAVVGSFTATGLADASVAAVLCLDALQYGEDKPAAFRELRRVLRPGGRFAITAVEVPVGVAADGEVADYAALAERAGLRVTHHAEVPGWRAPVSRNFELWQAHADELRAELGDPVAKVLLDEAAEVLERLPARRYVLLAGDR
jgi:ubiquinone/menaquinone biosynthesis C-methylase UbiE